MKTLFDGAYAPSTIGTLLREFSFGHASQLESVLGAHLAALPQGVDLVPCADVRTFVDIDSCCARSTDAPSRVPVTDTRKIVGKHLSIRNISGSGLESAI